MIYLKQLGVHLCSASLPPPSWLKELVYRLCSRVIVRCYRKKVFSDMTELENHVPSQCIITSNSISSTRICLVIASISRNVCSLRGLSNLKRIFNENEKIQPNQWLQINLPCSPWSCLQICKSTLWRLGLMSVCFSTVPWPQGHLFFFFPFYCFLYIKIGSYFKSYFLPRHTLKSYI